MIIYNFKNNKIFSFLKLIYRGFGRYKKRIVFLTVLGFLSSLAGGVGINALIPLFSFVTGEGTNGDDFISQAITKLFSFSGVAFNVKFLLVFVCLLFVLKAVLLILSSYVSVKIIAEYEARTRSNLFKIILKSDWLYLLKQKLGHLETVLMTNVKNCSLLLNHISTIIITLANLVVYVIIAINISAYITLITIAFSGLIFVLFHPAINKTRRIAYEEEKINRDIAHHINENILGMKTVKAMRADQRIIKFAQDSFGKLKDIRIKTYLFSTLPNVLMEPFSLIFICVVFAFFYKTPGFNLAALVAVIYLIRQIFSYAQQLQKYLLGASSLIPYLRGVLNFEEQAYNNNEKNTGSENFKFNQILEFKNITFSYNNKKNILSKVSFIIKKGEMVGLIGPSGAGKTTLVDLILRLFLPLEGEILLDGKNAGQINLNEWRENIGYVSQDMFLKNDTIANNIKFYDDSVTEENMETAAKKANIYDFILSLPQKFETIIGERGIEFSVGQRQRIVIARVLAQSPEILILDEATSALDNKSEKRIQKVIENLKGRLTVFVVAHRLSTVINCDKLLVLDKSTIVEEGRPSELLKDKDTYFYKAYNIRNK